MNRVTNKQQTIHATADRNHQLELGMGKCFLRSTHFIEEGSSARREGSLFEAALVNVCVFLSTYATIHMRIRNIKHHVKRITVLVLLITLPS
mmetsp:Transcript_23196/g.33133  ORF Transcript_23196/g.33133 Transcript_23196/m.33133 type:complete len:92 (+) Transcript_23196:649-924(+)